MDGYACRMEDIENELEVLEILQAGMVPSKIIGKNQCSKIMTGAAVPEGADCVFMVEHSISIQENVVKCTNPKTNKNICYRGEDYQTNEMLIKKERLSMFHKWQFWPEPDIRMLKLLLSQKSV